MSALTGLTLAITNTSTLTGGANITGPCNTNNLNVINNSNFSQSGSGTFSTGTGAVSLNGNVVCSLTSSFTGLATFNGNILLPTSKTLTLPTGRVISNTNDVVDTTSGQTVAGVKTFSNQIVANGGINAGSNTITCGTLTVGGLLTANNGIFIANNKSISTNDTGGALLFTGLGFSSTYAPNTGYGLGLTMNQNSNGEVSLFSLKNNSANAGGFSFYDYYTTTPTKTLLASLNISTGLTTNNLPINTGTGTITCGSINATNLSLTGIINPSPTGKQSSILSPTTFPSTNTGAQSGLGIFWDSLGGIGDTGFLNYAQGGGGGFTFYWSNSSNTPQKLVNFSGAGHTLYQSLTCTSINTQNNTITCGKINASISATAGNNNFTFFNSNTAVNTQIEVGNSETGNYNNVFGWVYNSGSPYGFLGLYGAGPTQICIDSAGVYIGSVQKPPNSGVYKLEVAGALGCATLTANSSITCGSYAGPNGSNIFLIPPTLPTTSNNTGLGIAWNATGGITDTAFLTYGQGGSTQGFTFYCVYSGANTRSLLATIATSGTSFNNTITANAGLTMGSNQNITLASTFTAPTTGQLGYNTSYSGIVGTFNSNTWTTFSSITLSVGVWLINAQPVFNSNSGSGAYSNPQFFLTPTSSGTTGFPTYSLQGGGGAFNSSSPPVSITFTQIVTVTSSTTYYLRGIITANVVMAVSIATTLSAIRIA